MNGNHPTGTVGVALALLLAVPTLTLAQVHPDGEPATPGPALRAASQRLTLLDAIAMALEQVPSLKLAEAREDAADAAAGEARAAWFPTLHVAASATQFQEPMVVFPIHGFQPGETPPFDETLFQAGATLEFLVFDGGARAARVRSARARVSAARAGVSVARQEVIARTVRAYLDVLGGREVLAAHWRRMDALAAERARVTRRLEAGRAAQIELLRVEAAMASAESERVRLASSLDVAERDLARLLGADPEATRADSLAIVVSRDADVPPGDALVARAREVSPILQGAQREVAAAEAVGAAARGARWPRLDLVGAYVDRGAASGENQAEWNVGVQLSYPVFTGGAVGSRIARADAERRAAGEALREAELQLAHDVERARAAVAEARARVASLETAVARFAEVVRIEQLRLAVGAATQTDYLQGEADLFETRAALIAARHGEIGARVELARLIGDLDPAWLARQVERGS